MHVNTKYTSFSAPSTFYFWFNMFWLTQRNVNKPFFPAYQRILSCIRTLAFINLWMYSQPCIIFMDEIDAIGGRRFSEGTSADREIQRTLMELLNQLDGFDQLGKVNFIMSMTTF